MSRRLDGGSRDTVPGQDACVWTEATAWPAPEQDGWR